MDESDTSTAGPDRIYQEHLAAGRFRIQRCDVCDAHVFYPRVLCPACGSPRLSWVAPRGTGTVHSTTVMRRKPEAGGDYNVALIELSEGPRLLSRVENLPPAAVRIGMTVRARIADAGTEGRLVVFDPMEPGHER